MASSVKDYPKTEKWSVISRRFCRYLKLPKGSAFKVVYKNCAAYPNGRVQRDNTIYRRKPFKKESLLQQIPDDMRIKVVINEHLLPYIDPALIGTKIKIVAYGPNKKPIDSNKYIGKWRDMPHVLTEDELEAERYQQEEVDEIAKEAIMHLRNLEELRSAELVVQGSIRALIKLYGGQMVRDVMKEEL